MKTINLIKEILLSNERKMFALELYKQLDISFDDFVSVINKMQEDDIIDVVFFGWTLIKLKKH